MCLTFHLPKNGRGQGSLHGAIEVKIVVCKQWLSLKEIIADMHILDLFDTDKGRPP